MHLLKEVWALSRMTLKISVFKKEKKDVLCLQTWLYLVPEKNKQRKGNPLNAFSEKNVFNHNSKLSFSFSLPTFKEMDK